MQECVGIQGKCSVYEQRGGLEGKKQQNIGKKPCGHKMKKSTEDMFDVVKAAKEKTKVKCCVQANVRERLIQSIKSM